MGFTFSRGVANAASCSVCCSAHACVLALPTCFFASKWLHLSAARVVEQFVSNGVLSVTVSKQITIANQPRHIHMSVRLPSQPLATVTQNMVGHRVCSLASLTGITPRGIGNRLLGGLNNNCVCSTYTSAVVYLDWYAIPTTLTSTLSRHLISPNLYRVYSAFPSCGWGHKSP